MARRSLPSPWNGLEIAKLATSLLTAAALGMLTYMIAREGQREETARAAAARDEAVRSAREAAQAARAAAIADKRVELWDKLGPLLGRLNFAFNSGHGFAQPPEPAAIRAVAGECENLLATYQIYFPAAFNAQVRNYLSGAEQAAVALESEGLGGTERAGLQANYLAVVEAARSALGVAHLDSGPPQAGVVLPDETTADTTREVPVGPARDAGGR